MSEKESEKDTRVGEAESESALEAEVAVGTDEDTTEQEESEELDELEADDEASVEYEEYEEEDEYEDEYEDDDDGWFVDYTPKGERRGFYYALRQSILLSILRSLFVRVRYAFHSSALFDLITNDSGIKRQFKKSVILGWLASLGGESWRLRKRRLDKARDKGKDGERTSRKRRRGGWLLRLSVVNIGWFLLAFGGFSTGIYVFDIMSDSVTALHPSQLYIGVFLFVISFPFLFTGKTVAEAIKSGNIPRAVFITFFGVNLFDDDDEAPFKAYVISFIMGAFFGVLATYWHLHLMVTVFVLLLCVTVILKSPETGILMLIFSIMFLPVELTCAGVVVVWLSFIYNFLRGRRVIRYEYIDFFPFVIMIALLLSTIISFGEGGMSAYVLFVVASVYFLVTGLIRDPYWASRCRWMIGLCGVISAFAWIFKKPLGLGMAAHELLEQGGAYDTALESTAVMVFMLAIAFFVLLSVFYASADILKRFFVFAVCAFLACIIFLNAGMLAAVIFGVLVLLATSFIGKGLRALPLLAVAGGGFACLIGILSAPELWSRFWGVCVERYYVLNDFASLLSFKDIESAGISLFGIGSRHGALDAIYGGALAAEPRSLFVWMALALGVPMTAFFVVMILMVLKYCRAHSRKCSDKSCASRIYGYGGAFAVCFAALLGITDNIWYNPRCAAMFWLVLGLTVSAQRYASQDIVQDYINEHSITPDI